MQLSANRPGEAEPARKNLEEAVERIAEAAHVLGKVAEAPWSVAEWAVALRFDHPRATVLVLVLG